MTRDEAFDILETIAELYPKYELTKRKAILLLPQIIKMDYDRVLEKLSAFALVHPYAPSLAEIAAYPRETNPHLEQMRIWQQEAAQVPEETKRLFKAQFEKVIKELAR
ncbi:hypothetical protein [Aquibacillus salsiterrae]|uniref:Replicative helicase inhibitor G39P N-terminal domain-containing protein n=1 Tax=Aquibacillus salsiterrae TaxID=2950439 RepID=A0A9X3WDX1_9BACI|nr:hypothetical protein [Aquibacillus salsiterrae]MDC3418067.1 hypothetical protein [Aquibacillus salsiterrae]